MAAFILECMAGFVGIRTQDRQNRLGINLIDRARPELGGASLKAPTPLLPVLLIAPLPRLRIEKLIRDRAESGFDSKAFCFPSNLNRVSP